MTKRQRVAQVYRWLEHNFPTARPTRLRFFRDPHHDDDGRVDETDEGDYVISINTYYPSTYCIHTLIEEHAHAEVLNRTPLHKRPWGDAYWRRRHAFDDSGGCADSFGF